MLDIAPTRAMYGATDMIFAKAYYHWFFLIQPYPYPENMITANPEAFMEHHMKAQLGRDVFDAECYDSYLEMMKDPDTVHAMCEDYRAGASIDMEEHGRDEEEGRKIQCPLMVLWGKHAVVERFDAVGEWRKVSTNSVEGESVDCGHYIPEEAPEGLVQKVLEFFK